MSRRKAADAAFAKALAFWEPPQGAGEARVCIASTYTFNAAFFETECLGRFLGMDTHPAESDAVSYMVEREEKLAAARVAVLADRRHACDKESLRWDVLGVLVPDAIQHSKVSLLAWANHVRVIVGSGNLTEPGYRKNLEVFGALDLSRKEGGNREAVTRVIDFLAELVNSAVGTDAPGAPKARVRATLSSVRTLIGRWAEVPARNPVLILGGPGRSILSQLAEAWPSGSPPRTAYVVSPFFDSDGNGAASALLQVLAKRRPREICFNVRTESGLEGRTRVFAPLPMVQLAAAQADVTVHRVLPEQRGELRDLHAKMIYLNNDDWRLVMAGSSNFTSAGLGAGGRANFEANLAYRLPESDPEAKVLDAVWPDVDDEPLDIDSEALVWDPQGEEDGEGVTVPLPAGFEEASFVPGSPGSLVITLRAPLPKSWSIQADGGRELLLSARRTGPGEHAIPWQGPEIPFLLQVTWTHKGGTAAASWPVNVSNPATLPPPEALRSLTLGELLQVLASTRPMPQAVAEVLARRKHKKGDGGDELDPLKRFDSQSFLLRRTKRLAAALERLRERLERPASSREAFEWRLFGPVGPMALAEGYMREASSAGEAKFCLGEIALVLHRVQPDKVAADGLPRATVAESLKKAIQQVAERAAQIPPVPEIDRYAASAFEEAAR
jgi:hypothetical protein